MSKYRSIIVAIIVALPIGTQGHAHEPLPTDTPRLFDEVYSRYQVQQKKVDALSLSFDLEISTNRVPDQARKPWNEKVYWDGKSVLIESFPYVYVSTPYRAFFLLRTSAEGPLSIAAMTPIASEERTRGEIDKFERQLPGSHNELIRPTRDKKFLGQLEGLKPRPPGTLDGHTTLPDGRIRFNFTVPRVNEPGSRPDKGYGIVDPKWDYNVVEYKVTTPMGKQDWADIECRFTYYPATADIPAALVKTYSQRQHIPSSKRPDSYKEVKYSNYKVEPVPEEKLTIAYYDLPDPATSPSRWPNPAVIAGVLGVAAVAAFLFYRRRQAKAVV